MRHDPAQTAEGWRPGPREHPADQGRHGLRLPLSERICPRSHPPQKRRGLTRTRQRTATRPPDSATSTVAMVSLGCCSTPSATIKPQTSICGEPAPAQTASTPQREKSRLVDPASSAAASPPPLSARAETDENFLVLYHYHHFATRGSTKGKLKSQQTPKDLRQTYIRIDEACDRIEAFLLAEKHGTPTNAPVTVTVDGSGSE